MHQVIAGLVENLSMVVTIARQMQNIAIRMVIESQVINKEAKAHFLRNIFYADEGGKKHRFGTEEPKPTNGF